MDRLRDDILSKVIQKKRDKYHRISTYAQSCPTLCNPIDCSPPVSSVHGILQARILEWVAILSPDSTSMWSPKKR